MSSADDCMNSPIAADKPADLLVQYLVAELECLNVRLSREILRWQRAGQDPTDAIRGLYVSDKQASNLVYRPIGTSWGQTVILSPEEETTIGEIRSWAVDYVRQLTEMFHSNGILTPLEQLAHRFNLDRFDLDAFIVCLAPALDLRYERLYGYLQDDITRKKPSLNLIFDLLCEPGMDRFSFFSHFYEDAPLIKWGILSRNGEQDPAGRSFLGQSLSVDETIISWLFGGYQPSPGMKGCISLSFPSEETVPEPLDAGLLETMQRGIHEQEILAFYGPDQNKQELAARWCAKQTGLPLLRIDLSNFNPSDAEFSHMLALIFRDIRLTGYLPCFHGLEACLEKDAQKGDFLAELYSLPGPIILSSHNRWLPDGAERMRRIVWVEHPVPSYDQRLFLWRHYLQDLPAIDSLDLDSLAGQFQLTSGQIRDAVATALDEIHTQNGEPGQRNLLNAARLHSNPRLSNLARKIPCHYTWSDIILPEDQLDLLHELVQAVKHRSRVLEGWKLGEKLVPNHGVTILFSGPPGTGKTMAAEVIAGVLGLDLYKINLSTIVSKYIGETEKNLERIFSEAEASNAILFFDEADALFGKRSEVRDSHDRYANIEISYLLQRMEAYDGVTILATNLRANLDQAFTRRLQFAVDFPFPDEEHRLRIWQTLFPGDVPRASDLDFAWLAEHYKLAGGSIRNIIVGAAYLAAADGGQVQMHHLTHSTRRELQKMGRLVVSGDIDTGV